MGTMMMRMLAFLAFAAAVSGYQPIVRIARNVAEAVPAAAPLQSADAMEIKIPEIEARNKKNMPQPQIYSFSITSEVKYRYARTVVSNKVANLANVSQQISFAVTLPDAAFISSFVMILKDKEYKAYVKEKEEARKDFEEAAERRENTGLVELSARDSNIFTVSVNVEAQSKVTFNLTYEQLLKRTLGLYENIINVNPGQIVQSLYVEVNIEESANVTVLQVPDFKTSEEIMDNELDPVVNKLANIKRNGTKVKITWNPSVERQKELSETGARGQFIVRYDVDHSQPAQILVDEGYFVHFYAPVDLKTLPKHVLFALDVSGSMGGKKIEQLRQALSQILGELSSGDFFTLVLFSDSIQLWTLDGTLGEVSSYWRYYEDRITTQAPDDYSVDGKLIIPATPENVAKAKAFASTLNETGGTNIIAALRKSLEIAQWGQNNTAKGVGPLVIFLTDGQPNVEMSDTEEIVKTVKKLNVDRYPIFSLAFGQGAEYDFLRKLSLSNAGFARNIYVASDANLQLKNFYKEVASPLLANVSFQYVPGQVQEDTLTKAIFHNFFSGSELVVAGKLADAGSKALKGNVSAFAYEGNFCVEIPTVTIPPPQEENRTFGHLEKLWAYMHIQELLDDDAVSDEKNSTYKFQALKLSLEYEFVTPLTSLVVVKPNETSSSSNVFKGFLDERYDSLAQPSGIAYSQLFQTQIVAKDSHFVAYWSKPMAYRPSPMAWDAFSNSPTSNAESSEDHIKRQEQDTIYSSNAGISSTTADSSNAEISSTTTTTTDSSNAGILSTTTDSSNAGILSTTTDSSNAGIPSTTTDSSNAGISSNPPLIATTAIPPLTHYLNVTDMKWLNGSTELSLFANSMAKYQIAWEDLPNGQFQACLLPDKTWSHCRHLAHCVIPQVLNSLEDLIPYAKDCVIDARFVGICCPPIQP